MHRTQETVPQLSSHFSDICNILILVVYKVLVGKPEGKRPLGRPRRRWVVGIRMDLGGCGLDSTGSG
jgi:hypothetical protein